MRLTPAQLIDRRITPPNDRLTGQIVDVDYYAHQMTVVLEGQSRVRVLIPDHLAAVMGTAASPKVTPGSWVLVERVNDEYVGTAFIARTFLPFVGRGAAFGPGAPVTTTLATPVWTSSGYPKQIGVSVYGDWGAVPGATAYEIWQNTVASPNGATLVKGGIGTTSYTWTLNVGQTSELLFNTGFESGDFSGFITTTPDPISPDPLWAISSADKHTGIYSAKFQALGGETNYRYLNSVWFPVEPSSYLTMSLWIKTVGDVGPASIIAGVDARLDGGGYAGVVALFPGTNYSSWTQLTGVSGALTNYNQMRIWIAIQPTGAGAFTVYVDDFSITGQSPITGTSTLYAVRAVDANGNASPFSTWLTAPQQSAKLGANSIEFDPANSRIESSNFVTGTAGFRIDENGIDGNLLTGGPSSHVHHDGETPSGTIDGVNATFTLAAPPNPGTGLKVYLNGLRLAAGAGNDYTLSGSTITFGAGMIPQSGDQLLTDYST